MADNQGFKQRELNNIEKTLADQMDYIQETYGAYCIKNNIAANYKIRRVA